MNEIKEYTFTGFAPSGNPFLWYFDENKRTAFETSIDVATWDKKPEVGDKIKYEKIPDHNGYCIVTNKVWINDELVYVRTKEKEIQKERITDSIYSDLIRKKGLKKQI